MKRVDVLIIGASLAGAACVRELWRRGIEAVAFDRDPFPRERVCGGFLSPGAGDLLEELGTLETLRRAGATDIRSSRIRLQDLAICVDLPRPGLGVSRKTLDAAMANHPGVQQGAVHKVERAGDTFRVGLAEAEVSARVVIDAAGKLSRFTPRRAAPQFGVQFYEPDSCGGILDFWFFKDGYGGKVTVEGGLSNACFLIYKDALPRYLNKAGCRVTGPVAYVRGRSDFIAIGDAAGMIDPFCGEGMRHALDTGMRAARVVAEGVTRGLPYDSMRQRYEEETAVRWKGKRRLGAFLRVMLTHPRLASFGLRRNPEYWFRRLWD